MIRTGAAVAASLLLAACVTTTVEPLVTLPSEAAGTLRVTSVNVVPETGTPPHIPLKLEQAVQTELRKRPPGAKPVSLRVALTRVEIVSSSSYFMAGALAGSTHLDVDVRVVGADGAQIANFAVKRESNPGGFAAFFDLETDMVQKTAAAIVQTLYGEQ